MAEPARDPGPFGWRRFRKSAAGMWGRPSGCQRGSLLVRTKSGEMKLAGTREWRVGIGESCGTGYSFREIRLAVFVAGAFFVVVIAPAAELWVASDGDDSAPGDISSPLATLEAARDRLRDDSQAGGTVWIRGGTYRLAETLVLDRRDAATKYAAWQDEEVVISGAERLRGEWLQVEVPEWWQGLANRGAGGVRRSAFCFWRQCRTVAGEDAGLPPVGCKTARGAVSKAPRDRRAPPILAGGVPRTDWGLFRCRNSRDRKVSLVDEPPAGRGIESGNRF